MGKLLSLLARDDSTCCSPKSYDVFLDFENAKPTLQEQDVYDEVDRVLKESEAVLDEIQCYKVNPIDCLPGGNQSRQEQDDKGPPAGIKLGYK